MHRFLFLFTCILFITSVHAEPGAPATLTLNTTSFVNQKTVPVLYTCDGKDTSPEFDWTNLPANTKTITLIVSDPDAPGGTFYHWVLYNIPTSVSALQEGMNKIPAGAMIGKNSFGKLQYNGPCPPKGSIHSYVFTIYALDTKLGIANGADGETVITAMQNHILGEAGLSATFSH